MHKRKKASASTEPWRAAAFIGISWDRTPSTQTELARSLRELDVHDMK